MSFLCKIRGHKFQETYVIENRDDFFEVDEAFYCRTCGEVEPVRAGA